MSTRCSRKSQRLQSFEYQYGFGKPSPFNVMSIGLQVLHEKRALVCRHLSSLGLGVSVVWWRSCIMLRPRHRRRGVELFVGKNTRVMHLAQPIQLI
jgi:hypothetical protein